MIAAILLSFAVVAGSPTSPPAPKGGAPIVLTGTTLCKNGIIKTSFTYRPGEKTAVMEWVYPNGGKVVGYVRMSDNMIVRLWVSGEEVNVATFLRTNPDPCQFVP